ncbi:biopolymer transporter ExbD [Hahella sp. SMD15-11]|uniref:Biopolymer transporter ExbD n=1 Tax=Thermohahella caldifontis TaxID=3142973 RepID=A0AB39UZ74_9GAMM
MKFRRQSRDQLDVNITPLIDVVFLLLIFFMVSTTFTKESHLTVTLPEAKGEVSSEQVRQVEVVINAEGQYTVNDRVLINNSLDTLKRAIQKLSDGDTSLPFIITADARTPHEYVVRAMDAAGQLGYQKLSITTQRTAQTP